MIVRTLLLSAGFGILSLARATAVGGAEPAAPPVSCQPVRFGHVTWGRNTVALRCQNRGPRAATLAIRIRSRFLDSGSGVSWEGAHPVLLAPGEGGEMNLDFFVRPDHGRLQVQLNVESAGEPRLHSESREFAFAAPYRDTYVLQPYLPTGGRISWDARVFPAFEVRESDHFIFYCLPGSEAHQDIDRIVRQREKILARLSREMRQELPEKGIVFFYPDPEIARRVTGHRGDGWTYGRTVVEVYGPLRRIDPYHELVHLLAIRIGSPPALFSEGLATARERHFDNAGRHRASVNAWCRGFLREGALIPIPELMQTRSLGEDLTRPRIAYPESACFVQYLLETHGWEKFRDAYASLVHTAEPTETERNVSRFQGIFGASVEQVEADWRRWLSGSKGRIVPPEIIRKVVLEETVPYLVARGRHLVTSGAPDQAEPVLRSAVDLAPNGVEAHFWLAQALHVGNKVEEALEEYGKVTRLGDRSSLMEVAWSRVWRGQILDRLGQRDAALAEYRQAEALRDTTQVQVEGRLTTSLEAAREGLTHPHRGPKP